MVIKLNWCSNSPACECPEHGGPKPEDPKDPMYLPADYEACGECGFDHAYEYEEAYKFHNS